MSTDSQTAELLALLEVADALRWWLLPADVERVTADIVAALVMGEDAYRVASCELRVPLTGLLPEGDVFAWAAACTDVERAWLRAQADAKRVAS